MASDDDLGKRDRDTLARMDDALDAIDALLFRLGQEGLQRMTRSSLVELQALAQTAHNAKLATLKRSLESLATTIERYLDRDPLFQMTEYLALINGVWLRTAATRRAREPGKPPGEMVEVIGESRRKYVERTDPLTVQPIGASGWVTDSDFVGITVYLQGDDGRVYQASNAKPSMYFGTDPRRLLEQPISDYQTLSIRKLAHGAFRFLRARVSRDLRLSIHKNLVIEPAPWRGAAAYADHAVRDWIELVERIRQAEVHPLRRGGPQFAYVEPAEFGEILLDQKRQVATLPLVDRRGAELLAEISLREENNFLIDNLERFVGKARDVRHADQPATTDDDPRNPSGRQASLRPDGLFGRVWVADGALKCLPLTAIYHDPVRFGAGEAVHEVHLSLESLQDVRAA